MRRGAAAALVGAQGSSLMAIETGMNPTNRLWMRRDCRTRTSLHGGRSSEACSKGGNGGRGGCAGIVFEGWVGAMGRGRLGSRGARTQRGEGPRTTSGYQLWIAGRAPGTLSERCRSSRFARRWSAGRCAWVAATGRRRRRPPLRRLGARRRCRFDGGIGARLVRCGRENSRASARVRGERSQGRPRP